MLWKEFAEKEDCDGCPLLENEICPGGFRCYGGKPIEPPCCYFKDDTDLDEWVNDYFDRQRRYEEAEDKRLQAERKKKDRVRKAADTRRAMRWYCWDEIQTLKRAQNALEAQKAVERLASSFAEAVNITNEMFRYKERVTVKPEISAEVQRLEAEVDMAKEAYNAKREKFYARWKKGDAENG